MKQYTAKDLLAYFDEKNLSYEVHSHAPVFTVAESEEIKSSLPGGHTKNLFLKDKKGNIALFSAHADAQVDLKALSKKMGLGRFSFGKPDLLQEKLGVTPGSVTAFALINDPQHTVAFALDKKLSMFDVVNFHPLVNSQTVSMAYEDFVKFINSLGRDLTLLEAA